MSKLFLKVLETNNIRESMTKYFSGFDKNHDPLWFQHLSSDPFNLDDPRIRIRLNPFVNRTNFGEISVRIKSVTR